MTSEEITIDADGRYAAGRGFQTLADEYVQFVEGLRGQRGDEAPLPYTEFSGPYLELRDALLGECRQLGEHLRRTGDGQVVMAERNVATEQVNTANAVWLGEGWAQI
ncbi:hypothetical protein AB0395_17830 [Streptosporangium sp. NPDC051023]|uniref:hypothetical protein n=1 Tax=Streptosporangium sp. NPDC051023 TaxID=3155410 RepID=UPI0034504E91